jgi:hypothetical protein
MRGRRHAVNGRRDSIAAMMEAPTDVVVGIVASIIERVVGPVGPEIRIIGPFPVVPRANQREIRRPGPPQVRVGPDHEAPTSAVDVENGVRAVVAESRSRVAEVARIPDEVVAAVSQLEEPQIQGRVRVHVRARGVVPWPTGRDAGVDRMRPKVAVASARNRIGRSLDIGGDWRRRRLGLARVARWGAVLGRRHLLRLVGSLSLNIFLGLLLRDGQTAQARDEPRNERQGERFCKTVHGQPQGAVCS